MKGGIITGSIYKVTNNINGKVYIGQTRLGPRFRWKQHINSSMCETSNDYNTHFHIAIRKYGEGAFTLEEIEECDNAELDAKEMFWINYYQSFNREHGYNLTLGGGGSQKYTNEEILMMWNQGKSVGEIHEEYGIDRGWISVRLKACGITDNEISHRRYKSAKEKLGVPVYQYALDGKYIRSFKSINEARRITGIGHIEKCCSEEQRQSGGFQWSYKKLDRLSPYEYVKPKIIPKEVLQIAKDTKRIVAEYKTISDASCVTGIDISGIAKVCKNKQRTAGGYIWVYKSDYKIKFV